MRSAAQTVQHHWFNADPIGPQIVHEGKNQKSGILSDTKDLTTIRASPPS